MQTSQPHKSIGFTAFHGILLLAFLLRLGVLLYGEVQGVSSSALSTQEMENISVSLQPFQDVAFYLANQGTQPPLYPLILSGLSSISTHALWLRLGSVSAGMALVYWGWRLGNYWGKAAGGVTALLLATSPPLVLASTQITHTIWLPLFAGIGLYYFWQWIQTRRRESLLVFETLILMSLYTGYASWFWVLGFNLVFFVTYWGYPAFFQIFWKRWLAGQSLLIALYLPWLLYVPQQFQRAAQSLLSLNNLPHSFGESFWDWGLLILAFIAILYHAIQARQSTAPTIATRHLSLILLAASLLIGSGFSPFQSLILPSFYVLTVLLVGGLISNPNKY